jgi:hypothetical protein
MTEALKLALEALEKFVDAIYVNSQQEAEAVCKANDAITAIKQARAAPVQEPVAWRYDLKHAGSFAGVSREYSPIKLSIGENWTPLYTTPPQRKPLTDKQILADETLRYYFGQNGGAGPVSKQGRKVVDAIEAAHGIKENT